MKAVTYRDSHGYLRRVLIRDIDSAEDAEFGIPDGPPDVRRIDWEAVMKQINDLLVTENIQTSTELQGKYALETIGNIVKRHVQALYREDDRARKEGSVGLGGSHG